MAFKPAIQPYAFVIGTNGELSHRISSLGAGFLQEIGRFHAVALILASGPEILTVNDRRAVNEAMKKYEYECMTSP